MPTLYLRRSHNFFFYSSCNHRALHSFPTRRSSDLVFTRMTSPVKSNHTGVTCGEPSGITVARLAKAFFCLSRSEEHTSELQSHVNLVCRLLLEKKNAQLQRLYGLKEIIFVGDRGMI